MAQLNTKRRVVSGMRPTGKLHLGHLVGALQNWERLQAEYDCFYFIADWHALTSSYADTGDIVESAIDNVADWIGAGVDPERSTIFAGVLRRLASSSASDALLGGSPGFGSSAPTSRIPSQPIK